MASRWISICGQEGVLGLRVELLQGLGVGGVAGPGPPGLGHLQLVEQHHLQLLRRAEVDLLAQDPEGLVGGAVDGGVELGFQRLQQTGVDGHPGLLHPRQGPLQGSSTPYSRLFRCGPRRRRPGASARSMTARTAPSPPARDFRTGVVVAEVEGSVRGGVQASGPASTFSSRLR